MTEHHIAGVLGIYRLYFYSPNDYSLAEEHHLILFRTFDDGEEFLISCRVF